MKTIHFILILLAGCLILDLVQARSLQSFSLKCAEKNCPEGIGRLLINKRGKVFNCTGFLISQDEFATNSHCIPKELKIDSQKECSHQLAVLFLDKKGNSFPVLCKKIKYFGRIGEHNIHARVKDLAIIQLSRPVANKPFSLTESGMQNNEEVSLWRVNSHNLFAKIEKVKCRVKHNSWVNPLSSTSSANRFTLSGCPTQIGNSGSPVVGDEGKVRAVFHSLYFPGAIAKLFKGNLQNPVNRLGAATHIKCLVRPETCKFDQLTNRQLHQARIQLLKKSFAQSIAMKQLKLPSMPQIKFDYHPGKANFAFSKGKLEFINTSKNVVTCPLSVKFNGDLQISSLSLKNCRANSPSVSKNLSL